MSALFAYIRAAFIVSLITGTVEKLVPTKLGRYVEFIAALILILFLFSPLKELAADLSEYLGESIRQEAAEDSEGDAEENASYEKLLSLAEKNAETSVRSDLQKRFDIDTLDVSLTLQMENDQSILLTEITVTLSFEDAAYAEQIEAYLEDTFGTETTILIEEAET